MGYRSDVIIAVSKETYIKHSLLLQDIPSLLKTQPPVHSELGVYWKLEYNKWYPDYADIEEIEEFFGTLAEEGEDFGAIRVGEEYRDVKEWGNPEEFEIYTQQSIYCPALEE